MRVGDYCRPVGGPVAAKEARIWHWRWGLHGGPFVAEGARIWHFAGAAQGRLAQPATCGPGRCARRAATFRDSLCLWAAFLGPCSLPRPERACGRAATVVPFFPVAPVPGGQR